MTEPAPEPEPEPPAPEEAPKDNFAKFRATKYFGSLDGLRALAIAMVIWHHAATRFWPDMPTLLSHGHHGVTLFFALSGFLITTLLLRERRKHGKISVGAFFMRRALRIFPLYYAVLGLYVAIVFFVERNAEDKAEFFANLPAYATYTSNWFVQLHGDERVIFYFAWSLAAEEQFYLVWPWIERFMKPAIVVTGVLTAIAAWVALDQGAFSAVLAQDTLTYRILHSFNPPIALGALFAHVLDSEKGYRALRILQHRFAPVVALGLAVLTLSFEWMPLLAIHVALALLVVSVAVTEDHAMASILSWKPFVKIGQVSYGMYLLHMLSLNVVLRTIGNIHLALTFTATTAVAYGAAFTSFHLFEKRFLELKKRFAK